MIYYRDGVSEAEYDVVLAAEGRAIIGSASPTRALSQGHD